MKIKSIVITLILTIALVIACLVLMNKEKASWRPAKEVNKNFFPKSLDINQICGMKIYDKDSSVQLKKIDNSWKVEERKNYPADFSKIGSFILKLSELKIMDTVDAGESQYGRLMLLDPKKGKNKDKAGIVIEFQDKSGKVLEKIIVGKMHERQNSDSPFGAGMPDGRYVKLQSSKKPVLISETLYGFSTKPAQWLDKDFLKIENIKSITCENSEKDKTWTLSKDDKNAKFKVFDVPDGKEENTSPINAATGAFNYLTFSDLYTDDFDFKKNDKFKEIANLEIKTFDDFVYKVKIAESKDKCIANFKVDADLPKKRISDKDEKKEDKEKLDKEFAVKIQKLKDKLEKEKQFSEYIYEIPKYKADTLLKKKADFLKDKPKPKKNKTVENKKNSKNKVKISNKKNKKVKRVQNEKEKKKTTTKENVNMNKKETNELDNN